ncbi:hypothetical protein APA_4844 [Pseudanabaena sp. lw0831]|uniref:hypothetical protein n=1 Tax=Pseudanabaena sp. lw0831 TaxID=1357935 RepID=UPI0019158C5D|nr:hypothetical protein [Pseudanabaena sp. lw0831]GBO56509.1 hypothetical protein APA_4844 [Pseudanabaena sp. lw0831]
MNWVKRFIILGSVAISSLMIAQSASARFVIFVAGNDAATLQRVRNVSPTAFATKINDQPVIQAGTFNSETSADSLAISLQQSGLSAQKYFRASGGKETNVQVPFSEATTSSVNSSVVALPNPQQVVIQSSQTPQPVSFQVDSQPQVFSSAPQQAISYNQNQYQQITTNTVVPQVQTQQVLVPRWQQVLVPETRQVVTQTVVPQTQIVQTGYTQQATGYVQPATTTYVQPVQATGYTQTTGYVQPQTGFIPTTSTTLAPTTFDNSTATSFALPPQSTNTAYSSSSYTNTATNEPQLPQATQNSNFRYVAAIPAAASNQFLLSRVRQYVPNAFLTNSGRGTYIHAGAYQSRDSAEAVSRYLRSQGVDSRVLYF